MKHRKRLIDHKLNYNLKIKEFRNIESRLDDNEKIICDLQKKVCRFKQNQKLFINSITIEFIQHFQDNIQRVPKEIEIIFNTFLGFKVTPFNNVKVNYH